ncbi:hypothetical protein [Burkholderia cenocepacia]|uniref:hypothetical protein n=1 Tax=Burkholderia cenocepacia TaxID=95486 RepID=UPI00076DE8BA|nr:hypothetical protein [Burkholderia cenocepacia]KWU26321.1 hypothetical protein AS149_25355 [Burkholderia cenocepacia]
MKFEKLPSGNLALIMDPVDADEVAELLRNATHLDHGFLGDLLEYARWPGNGLLYQVSPESIGALTDAPILTDELVLTDAGDAVVEGKVWWYEPYQVSSFAEVLLRDGRVVFQHAG